MPGASAGSGWSSALGGKTVPRTVLCPASTHTGLKAAIARVFEATWQRCRVHWMRNALAHVSRGQHTVVAAHPRHRSNRWRDAAPVRQAFDQPDRAHAGETWRKVSEQLRPRWPKLAELMDRAVVTPLVRETMARSEHDVLAYIGLRPFLPQTVHWTVCRLRRTGANSPDSIGPSCTPRTRSSA